MSTTNCIPQSSNDLESQTICALLDDISEARAKGQIADKVCLFCEHCQCLVIASARAPEPVHHCGTVLEIATCCCCGQPATHFRMMSGKGTDGYTLDAFADGHFYGWRANRARAMEVLDASPLTGGCR